MSKDEIERVVDRLAEETPSPEDIDFGEPEAEFELAPARHDGTRDFRSEAMRRVDGALSEILTLTGGLVSQITEHGDAGNWDLQPADLENYDYTVDALSNMVDRLKQPNL